MQVSQKQWEGLNRDKLIEIILMQSGRIEEQEKRISRLEEELKVPSGGAAPFRVPSSKRKAAAKESGA